MVSAQNDASENRTSGSKTCKDSSKLSYVSQESKETSVDPRIQDSPLSSFASETTEKATGSLAIQNLFKKWLMLLRSQPTTSQVGEDMPIDQTPKYVSETRKVVQKKGRKGMKS